MSYEVLEKTNENSLKYMPCISYILCIFEVSNKRKLKKTNTMKTKIEISQSEFETKFNLAVVHPNFDIHTKVGKRRNSLGRPAFFSLETGEPMTTFMKGQEFKVAIMNREIYNIKLDNN